MKNRLVLLLLALSLEAGACSCFPTELRAKTALDTLVTACDKHPPSHNLLDTFRSNAAKAI